MPARPLRSNLWILAPIVALSAAQACSSSSDGTKGSAGAPSAGSGAQGGAVEAGGRGGGLATGGNAGSSSTPSGGAEDAGAAGNAAGGNDDTAGAPSAARGDSSAGGTTNGGAGESSVAGDGSEAGDSSQAGAAPKGGSGGTSSGGAGGATSCIKAVKGNYVVRTDGAVLVEQRDTTKEAAILDGAGVALTGAVDAAVGTYHGCALMADGTVYCWRETAARGNWSGQLGNGVVDQDATAKLEQATQVLVDVGTPLTGVTAITRGGPGLQSTCAITSGHQLYCWGDVAWLVNGGTASASPYAQAITTNGITPLAGVVQASAGANKACAVVKNGASNELYCWGRNDYHNLATGDTTKRQYPTKVAGLTSPSLVQVVDYAYNPERSSRSGPAARRDLST
jgi:hypothetical protein